MTHDVAVVGGGVIGLAIARELRLAGVGDVLVLERGPAPGQGSSARANGGVRAQFTTRPNIEFSLASIDAFEHWQRDSRGTFAFQQVGYLLLTGTRAGERGLRAACELQRSLGVDTEWLSAEEVLQRAPFLRADALRAGTFHRRDGFLDPHGVVSFLANECRRLSVEIRTNAGLLAIEHSAGAPYALQTTAGDARADVVVNAAGPDAAGVAAMRRQELPVHPVRRNLAYVQAPAADLIPMCVDLDTGVLVRREVGGGYVLAYSNPDDPPSRETSLDPAFLRELGERVGNRFPFLERLEIDPRQCWAGLYPETPDHHAIVGAFDGEPAFVHCAGFGGHGLMHSPAAARAVAELVVDGRCTTFDLHALRPSRFEDGDLVPEAAVF